MVEALMGNLITGSVLGAAGAAIAMGVSGISSAKGLGIAGNAASGATGEDESNFSSSLILQALPQTQAVYGFIIGILIILGIMSGGMGLEKGMLSLAAGIASGLTGISGIYQGEVAASSIGASAKNPSVRGKVLIFVVMPEIAALFGFVIGIMILISGSVF